MPRNKYPEITEERILSAAAKLFSEKGWEHTTIQDIVQELGDLTRGAFYHHFKSKEDVINAVLDRAASEQDSFKEVRKDTGMNGLEKLRKAFLLSFENMEQISAVKAVPDLLTEPKVIAKQMKIAVEFGAKDILQLIQEGMQDASINVRYPKQVAETYILLTNIWLSPILFKVSPVEYAEKALHLQELYAAIGLPVIDDSILEKLKEFYTALQKK